MGRRKKSYRSDYYRNLVVHGQEIKATALVCILQCLDRGPATAEQICLYIREQNGDPSSYAGAIIRQHPSDLSLVQTLLRTLVEEDRVLESEGLFSRPLHRDLDSDWNWGN